MIAIGLLLGIVLGVPFATFSTRGHLSGDGLMVAWFGGLILLCMVGLLVAIAVNPPDLRPTPAMAPFDSCAPVTLSPRPALCPATP